MGNLNNKKDRRAGKDSMPGIHLAVQYGNWYALARRHVHDASQVNLQDAHGTTPLLLAAQLGRSEMVTLLVDHGADPTASDHSKLTSLHHAASGGHIKCLEQLLRTPAAFMVDNRDVWGYTPIHRAIINQHDKAAEILLSYGCSVNLPDENKRVPLHVAASYGNKMMVHNLVKESAIINWPDDKGRTPLYFAVLGNHVSTVEQLIADGCNVNHLTARNVSALKLAVHKGFVNCVHLLLSSGAKIQETNTPEGNLLAHSVSLAQRDSSRGSKANDYLQIARLLISAASGSTLSPLTFSLALQGYQESNNLVFLLIIKLMFAAGIPTTSLPPVNNINDNQVRLFVRSHLTSCQCLQDLCRQQIRNSLVQNSGNVLNGTRLANFPQMLSDIILLNDVYVLPS